MHTHSNFLFIGDSGETACVTLTDFTKSFVACQGKLQLDGARGLRVTGEVTDDHREHTERVHHVRLSHTPHQGEGGPPLPFFAARWPCLAPPDVACEKAYHGVC